MRIPVVVSSLALVVSAGVTQAQTVYTSRSAFNAAGGGTGTFLDLEGFSNAITPAPFTIGSLSASGNVLYVPVSATTSGSYGAPNASSWLQVRLDTFGSTATLSAPSFALIGFDIRPYDDGNSSDAGETISFSTNTGVSGTFVTPSTNVSAFVGFSFAAPVTSITFAATNGGGNSFSWFGTDNYQLWSQQATGAVPEPASWAMMVAGFGVLGGVLRRRRGTVGFA